MHLLPLFLTAALPLTTTAFFSSSGGASASDDSLAVPGENPLKYCEDPSTNSHILRIKSVDLTPNPPSAGETLSIKATGNFTEVVEDGAYVNLVVKLGLITILRRREDLCAQMKEVDKECPLQKGETTVTRDVELPKAIPPGKFTVTADVYTKDDARITCLNAEISFSRKSSSNAKKLEQMEQKIKDSVDL